MKFLKLTKDQFKSRSLGFVILFAVLLVSIVLVISLSLFNITIKQLLISFVARESQIAFFAADNALNCTVFLDSIEGSENPFGHVEETSTGTSTPPRKSWVQGVADINCGPHSVVPELRTPYDVRFVWYQDEIDSGRRPCAIVTWSGEPVLNAAGDLLRVRRTITTRGFNNSDVGGGECPLSGDRVVERGLEMIY